jgi:hypothetical protein
MTKEPKLRIHTITVTAALKFGIEACVLKTKAGKPGNITNEIFKIFIENY